MQYDNPALALFDAAYRLRRRDHIRAKNQAFVETWGGGTTPQAFFDAAYRLRRRGKRARPADQAPVGSWWYDRENDRTIQVTYHKGDELIEFARYPDINPHGTTYTMKVGKFVAAYHHIDQ